MGDDVKNDLLGTTDVTTQNFAGAAIPEGNGPKEAETTQNVDTSSTTQQDGEVVAAATNSNTDDGAADSSVASTSAAVNTQSSPAAGEGAVNAQSETAGGVSITSTSGTSASPDATETGLDYDEMIRQLIEQNKPKSEAEIKEQERREKREKMWAAIGDGLAAVTGLAFAPYTGYSNYDPKHSMSEKAQRRWDKMKAEQKADTQVWFNMYDRAKARQDQNARWKAEFEYRQGRDKVGDDRYAAEQEYRKGRDKIADDRYAAERAYREMIDNKNFDMAEKKFQEMVRMNNEQIRMHRAQLARSARDNSMQFLVGGDMINVPTKALNNQTVSAVFQKLTDKEREAVYKALGKVKVHDGAIVTDSNRNPVYEPLTADQMLQGIGAVSNTNKDVQSALKILTGKYN